MSDFKDRRVHFRDSGMKGPTLYAKELLQTHIKLKKKQQQKYVLGSEKERFYMSSSVLGFFMDLGFPTLLFLFFFIFFFYLFIFLFIYLFIFFFWRGGGWRGLWGWEEVSALFVICLFYGCFVVFVCHSLWCWGLGVDLIVSVSELSCLLY